MIKIAYGRIESKTRYDEGELQLPKCNTLGKESDVLLSNEVHWYSVSHVRDVVDENLILMLKIHIDVNLVDILTKPVTREKFSWSMTSLSLGAT